MQVEAAPMVHSVAASAWGGAGSSRTIPMLHIRRPVTSSSMAHSRVVGLVSVNTGIVAIHFLHLHHGGRRIALRRTTVLTAGSFDGHSEYLLEALNQQDL